MKFNTSEIHERKHRVLLDRHQLTDLVTEAVCKEIGVNPKREGVTVTVKFEKQEEGSPAYVVGTKATIDVVEDMSPRVLPQPSSTPNT